MGCCHASFLDVKALSEDMDKAEVSTIGQLLQKKGLEHEAFTSNSSKTKASLLLKSSKDSNLRDRAQLTLEAMQFGAD